MFPASAQSCQPLACVAERIGHMLGKTFLSAGSTFSLVSLAAALLIAAAYLAWRRPGRRRSVRVLVRALFPRWLAGSASSRADLGFMLLNLFVTSTLIGWALFSYAAIAHGTAGVLASAFGSAPRIGASPALQGAFVTLALFLAYDFAYWADHWLKHKIPFLWEFHRVHHTAEVLSPVTVFRTHPVDTLVFSNISAVVIGAAQGACLYAFGGGREAAVSGTNLIFVGFVFAVVHLQHSHVPIRTKGWLGKLLLSPAHHQIHHSTLEVHYGSNLGSCLAVWDWIFGTLVLPEQVEGRLRFGAETKADPYGPHTITGGLVLPFIRAARALTPKPSATTVTRPQALEA